MKRAVQRKMKGKKTLVMIVNMTGNNVVFKPVKNGRGREGTEIGLEG